MVALALNSLSTTDKLKPIVKVTLRRIALGAALIHKAVSAAQ
jgi:hypothetical protein